MLVPGFSRKLEALLKQRGISQAAFASKVGITANHLSRVKTGGDNISEKFMEKVCAALGITPSEFIGDPLNSESEYYPVPLREVGGGMGGGYQSDSRRVMSYISLRRDYILTKTSNPEKLSFIQRRLSV